MLPRILLLLSAACLLAGCPGSTLSFLRPTAPERCLHVPPPLKTLQTGTQDELELWVIDTAPKYRDLKKDYLCLKDWATE